MRGTIGRRLSGPLQHSRPQLRREFLRRLAGMYGRQTRRSVLFIPLLPARDGRRRGSQLLFDVAVGCSLIQQKNDAHALRHARRQIPFPQVALQFASFARSQVQDFHLRHKIYDEGSYAICYSGTAH